MNVRYISLVASFLATLHPALADLSESLKEFSTYQPGQTRVILHETRHLALKDAHVGEVRAMNEQLLLEFIQSDATVAARREACLWLGSIATEKSRPVLTLLAETKELAGMATLALEVLDGPPATVAVPPSTKLARFRTAVAASKNRPALLIEAFQSDDHGLARLAFSMLDEGGEASDWLATYWPKLTSDRQILALNTLASIRDNRIDAVTSLMALEGKPEARVQAISRLGRAADLALLDQFISDPVLSPAVSIAFINMDGTIVHEHLLALLGSKDPVTRKLAFEVIAGRAEPFAVSKLRSIAADESSPDRATAIRTLGACADSAEFEALLRTFVVESGSSLRPDYQNAVWSLALRHPDYPKVLELIDRFQKTAPPATAKSLAGMASKLAKLQAVPTLKQLRSKPMPAAHRGVLLPGPFSEIVPARFEIAAYLDCGANTHVKENGISISRLSGSSYQSERGIDPSVSVDSAADSLDYEVAGLVPDTDYILGMTWWDPGLQSRRQSLSINGDLVLPDARPVAFDESSDRGVSTPGKPTPARIQFALTEAQISGKSLRLSIRKLAGPNAVNSELWILKRNKPAAEKQILLLSGQDYPAHHWRKTGPLMAEIITADPRLEVTICESPYALALPQLDQYDAVLIHFKNYEAQLPSTPEMHARLTQYLHNGGGMCMSHFACGAMEEWPEFVGLAGRVWNGKGHDPRGPFTVRVVDAGHPVTRGLGDFETFDELYFCLHGDPEINLLCDARSKVKNALQAQAFTYQPGKGRVFMCTLGHDLQAYESAGTRTLYRQAAAWCSGLK